MSDVPNFSKWDVAALIKFSSEAYTRMQHDAEEIASLKTTVKDAIQAYRTLVINHDKEKQNASYKH